MPEQRLTTEGELPIGVTVDGVTHARFVLRQPTVRDNIAAIDEVGTDNPVALSAALYALQLVELGTLKPEQITYELICDMHPADFNALDAAAGELAKKALPAAAGEPIGSSSASLFIGLLASAIRRHKN
jgi:hypothetical protein